MNVPLKKIGKHFKFIFFAPILLVLLSIQSTAHGANPALQCEVLLGTAPSVTRSSQEASFAKPHRSVIENIIGSKQPTMPADDQLRLEVMTLKTENPDLATQVDAALHLKKRKQSLQIDLSSLPTFMSNFIHGPWKKLLGDRGVSAPFLSVTQIDENTLVIKQQGDTFPMMVRWVNEITSPQKARLIKLNQENYLALELPGTMKSESELKSLNPKYIFSLISGSSLNKYISNENSRIGRITALLHDHQLFFDRPTQSESKAVTDLLKNDTTLRTKVRSLLFVAPTASGKTRVLGDRVVSQIQNAIQQLKNQNPDTKKLTILMTKTPDLTADLAKSIGGQVLTEFGSQQVRVIQWGGEFSEPMGFSELLTLIQNSKTPILLVTSYPTLGARVNSASQKSDLLKQTNGLMIDEAHNATGAVFEEMMSLASQQAELDRKNKKFNSALDIFGVTASPITRQQRTVEMFDYSFWAGIDQPTTWAKKIIQPGKIKPTLSVLDWIRVIRQYNIARDRGEIAAADPMYYRPEERGFKFSTIFSRDKAGGAPKVSLEKLKEIWPDVQNLIDSHGPGVIQTYPRDAEAVAQTLSELSGKNFISLQSLKVSERAAVYEAFRKQTPYQGKNVDAIVGTIQEGLDFPQAGWYLSFKKYVRFPENIQGPGRVVRLALNKPSPVIIFFGEQVNKIAYEKVRELVMSRLGRLPRALNQTQLYSGARRGPEADKITTVIQDANLAIETLVRIRGDLSTQLGSKETLDPTKIADMQSVLRDIRLSGDHREIDLIITDLVSELYSFPFFNGQLKSTWKLCDRLIAQTKKPEGTPLPHTWSDSEKIIFQNPELMAQVKLFRSTFAMLGPIPRAILEEMSLTPLNVTEIATSVNAFVERNQGAPTLFQDQPAALKTLVDLASKTSPDGFWRALTSKAKIQMRGLIPNHNQVSFEQALNQYFKVYGKLPEAGYKLINNNQITAADRISAKLMDELIARLKSGDLNLTQMSQDLIQALDQSDFFVELAVQISLATEALVRVPQAELTEPRQAYLQRLKSEGLLNYENLMAIGDFRLLFVIKNIAESQSTSSANAKHFYEEILQTLQPSE